MELWQLVSRICEDQKFAVTIGNTGFGLTKRDSKPVAVDHAVQS